MMREPGARAAETSRSRSARSPAAHLSHLSAAFKKNYGITLREALRRYRRQSDRS